jgi:hypothetical protein
LAEIGRRRYLLYKGPLAGMDRFSVGRFRYVFNYAWPDDHAWLVAADLDARSAYIGCSGACADARLSSSLEAQMASLSSEFLVDG